MLVFIWLYLRRVGSAEFYRELQRTDINGAIVDDYLYKKGGLGRCSADESAKT